MLGFGAKKRKKESLQYGLRVGLEIGPDGVSVAIVDLVDKETVKIVDSTFIAEQDPLKQRAKLLNWSSKYSKRALPCIVTLHPADYQLLLVESPRVPDKDLHQAMRWRLQDLLNYSVDHAVYDLFKVPEDAYRGRISMAYVAVAPNAAIKKIISMVEKNGMRPERVSIRELSFRNLILNGPESDKTVLSVWLDSFSGGITLISNHQVYFSRRLEKEERQWDAKFLLQEIERSMEYSINQLGQEKIDVIELVLAESLVNELAPRIKEHLEAPVEVFRLQNRYQLVDEKLSDRCDALHLSAIGAASYPVADE